MVIFKVRVLRSTVRVIYIEAEDVVSAKDLVKKEIYEDWSEIGDVRLLVLDISRPIR